MTWITLPAECSNLRTPPAAQDAPRWFEFRNSTADEAELLIFDEIGGWGLWADEFVAQLDQVTAPKLTVRLNSPGGSVFQGVAIANALRAHPATVTVRVEALAASIASVIALAGDRLLMSPSSMFMIHDASGGCWGQASDMAKMSEILDKISDNIADAYAAKAGGTRAEWRERMLAETWYTAAEAVEAGLADELMAPPQTNDTDAPKGPRDATRLMTARWDLSVFRYAGRENAPSPVIPAADTQTNPQDAGPTGDHGGRLPYPLSEHPKTQALADVASPVSDATPHSLRAEEPVPQPVPETRTADSAADPHAAGSVAGTDWADLVAHLFTPAEPSAEDLLAHLREAM